jgi:hypothetical protein
MAKPVAAGSKPRCCRYTAGAVALVSTDSLWLIGLSQLVIGVADTSIAPLVAMASAARLYAVRSISAPTGVVARRPASPARPMAKPDTSFAS